jgi:hypothetical protein
MLVLLGISDGADHSGDERTGAGEFGQQRAR